MDIRNTDTNAESAVERYDRIRARSLALVDPLSPEDATAQSMPDTSPSKWHLAHTSWFFETFILQTNLSDYQVFDDAFEVLFNSYYNAVGEQFSRPDRGLLTRPGLKRVIEYREHVDNAMHRLFEQIGTEPIDSLLTVGVHHEQQHQELILMDIKHLLSLNPINPVYQNAARPNAVSSDESHWQSFEKSLGICGYTGDGFCFDNEMPAHEALTPIFELASRPVTNGEFKQFIEDGGYRNPLLWLADGWAFVNTNGVCAPFYWRQRGEQWCEFTLHGELLVDESAPVCHVSYYEADAFARWAGARLPTEFEWERAAREQAISGHFMDDEYFQPREFQGDDDDDFEQLFGGVWEWTSSPYVPYPGFRVADGAIGEYNGKFMSNQMVLRGGACVTPHDHIRASYRNFFYPHNRWQFGGLRLARDT